MQNKQCGTRLCPYTALFFIYSMILILLSFSYIYCHFSEDWREKKIKDVDEDFRHPWRVVDFLKDELHSSCIGYSHTGEHCEDDCERRLSWWPILTCKQAHWQIFEFRKEV